MERLLDEYDIHVPGMHYEGDELVVTDRRLLDEVEKHQKHIDSLQEWLDDFHPEKYSPKSKVIVSEKGHYTPHDCEFLVVTQHH
mgnify:CR=1 FL=1